MGGISGNLIGLKVNGAFISCEVACAFNFENELIAASSVTSAGFEESIQGIRRWSISVDGNLLLEAVPSDIKGIITTGYMKQLPMYAEFSTRASSSIEMKLTGAVVFQSGSINAPASGVTSWNCVLKGTGPLTTVYTDFDLLIDAMPSEADWPIIVDEDV